MSAPPGFGAPPGFPAVPAQPQAQANGNETLSRMDGDFFGQMTQEEIDKKSRKWRATQKKRFNEKRRRGGGGGVDFGKAVSVV
jgi:pre-mRNA-processing factor 8